MTAKKSSPNKNRPGVRRKKNETSASNPKALSSNEIIAPSIPKKSKNDQISIQCPPPKELAGPNPKPQGAPLYSLNKLLNPHSLLLVALFAFPTLTLWTWSWPNPGKAFLSAFVWCFAFSWPALSLQSGFRLGRDSAQSIGLGAARGAGWASQGACMLLWLGAIWGQMLPVEAVGGQSVDRYCVDKTCNVGFFNHKTNSRIEFILRKESMPETVGFYAGQCLHPSWPQPSRLRWQDPLKGCWLHDGAFETIFR